VCCDRPPYEDLWNEIIVSNDSVCSFRAANRLGALTSRNIVDRTITIISEVSRLNVHPPTTLPITTSMTAEISDNFIGLPPASRLSSYSFHLCDSLRYRMNPSSPPPRNPWLHDKISLKRATSANSVTERILRLNADSDSA